MRSRCSITSNQGAEQRHECKPDATFYLLALHHGFAILYLLRVVLLFEDMRILLDRVPRLPSLSLGMTSSHGKSPGGWAHLSSHQEKSRPESQSHGSGFHLLISASTYLKEPLCVDYHHERS